MNRSIATIGLLLLVMGFAAVVVTGMNRPTRRDTITPAPLGHRININTADAPTLTLLRGIGPRLANAVVDHRHASGPFETVDALDDVKGIGPRTLATIRDYLTTH